MTSERKVAANRLNSRKGRGPRSAAGKATASRNALRHGLAGIHQPVSATDIESFAKALCGNNDNPSLFEQAMVIARNELVLRAISAQQLAVVERVREPWVIALARGDNTLKLRRARFRERDKASTNARHSATNCSKNTRTSCRRPASTNRRCAKWTCWFRPDLKPFWRKRNADWLRTRRIRT